MKEKKEESQKVKFLERPFFKAIKDKYEKFSCTKFGHVFTKNIGAWLLLLPCLLLFAFYIWVPLICNLFLSMFETKGWNPERFVFLDNYIFIFQDSTAQSAWGNTLLYTFWSIVIGFLLPIILAIVINEVIHFKGLFRSAFYIPNMVPGIAAVFMWLLFFDPNSYGVFNSMLESLGLESSSWLQNEHLVIPLIVLTMTWKGAGATMLIYLATLQGIDNTYYEAARIEGASVFQRIRLVTIPHLKPLISTLLILQVISVFQIFYEPLVMTKGGGPTNHSMSLVLLIYNYAFKNINAGRAAALGVMVSAVLIGLTALYNFVNKKVRA